MCVYSVSFSVFLIEVSEQGFLCFSYFQHSTACPALFIFLTLVIFGKNRRNFSRYISCFIFPSCFLSLAQNSDRFIFISEILCSGYESSCFLHHGDPCCFSKQTKRGGHALSSWFLSRSLRRTVPRSISWRLRWSGPCSTLSQDYKSARRVPLTRVPHQRSISLQRRLPLQRRIPCRGLIFGITCVL